MSKQKFLIGFSLVELLVVVAITLILVGIGSYSINQFNQTSKLVKSRDSISSQIKLARNLSITNQLPDGKLNLSYVRVTISGNKIIAEGVNGVGIGTTESPYFSSKLEIPEGTVITIINNSNIISSFGFSDKYGRLTDGGGEFLDTPVVVKIVNGSEEYSITISDLGIINTDDN